MDDAETSEASEVGAGKEVGLVEYLEGRATFFITWKKPIRKKRARILHDTAEVLAQSGFTVEAAGEDWQLWVRGDQYGAGPAKEPTYRAGFRIVMEPEREDG